MKIISFALLSCALLHGCTPSYGDDVVNQFLPFINYYHNKLTDWNNQIQQAAADHFRHFDSMVDLMKRTHEGRLKFWLGSYDGRTNATLTQTGTAGNLTLIQECLKDNIINKMIFVEKMNANLEIDLKMQDKIVDLTKTTFEAEKQLILAQHLGINHDIDTCRNMTNPTEEEQCFIHKCIDDNGWPLSMLAINTTMDITLNKMDQYEKDMGTLMSDFNLYMDMLAGGWEENFITTFRNCIMDIINQ